MNKTLRRLQFTAHKCIKIIKYAQYSIRWKSMKNVLLKQQTSPSRLCRTLMNTNIFCHYLNSSKSNILPKYSSITNICKVTDEMKLKKNYIKGYVKKNLWTNIYPRKKFKWRGRLRWVYRLQCDDLQRCFCLLPSSVKNYVSNLISNVKYRAQLWTVTYYQEQNKEFDF